VRQASKQAPIESLKLLYFFNSFPLQYHPKVKLTLLVLFAVPLLPSKPNTNANDLNGQQPNCVEFTIFIAKFGGSDSWEATRRRNQSAAANKDWEQATLADLLATSCVCWRANE